MGALEDRHPGLRTDARKHKSMPTGARAVAVGEATDLSQRFAGVGVFAILTGIILQAFPVPAEIPATVVGASAGLVLVTEGRKWAVLRNYGLALYLFGAIFLAGTVLSILDSGSIPRSVRVSLSLLPQLLLFHVIASRFDRTRLDWLVWALIGTAAATACMFLATALGHPSQSPTEWILSPTKWMKVAGLPYLSVPNDLLVLVLVAPFAAALLTTETSWRIRALLLISLVMFLAALTVYASRTGVALFVLSVTWVIAMRARVRWRLVIWGLLLVIGLLLLVDAATGFRILRKFSYVETLSLRIPLWTAAWKMFLAAPWLGHGPGMFSVLYEGYLNGTRFPEWVLLLPALHAPWAHSLYLELLAERGFTGFVSFVGVILVVASMLRALRPRSMDDPLWLAVTVSLALILLGGLSEFSLLRYWFSQLVLVLLAMVLALNSMGGIRDERAT
jgi:O-antigen ligase